MFFVQTGLDHATEFCPVLLKPAPDARQAGLQSTDFLGLDAHGEVYELLQRIRALTHVALLNNPVHKEANDCSYNVGDYDGGCGLQVPALASRLNHVQQRTTCPVMQEVKDCAARSGALYRRGSPRGQRAGAQHVRGPGPDAPLGQRVRHRTQVYPARCSTLALHICTHRDQLLRLASPAAGAQVRPAAHAGARAGGR